MRTSSLVDFRRRVGPAIAAVVVAAAAVAISPSAEALDDPDLDYHTITTPHFYVHYHDGLEDLAHRSAEIAEESHEVLSPLLDWEPASRTHLMVTDKLDRANGFARVYGRNFITIFGKPPTPEGVLGYYDDWLRVLIYHEYVHILHLDTNPGISQWINRMIGKQLHPNAVLPRWYVEGIAVYLETARTGRGRTNSPLFRMWLRVAALDDDLFELGRATGLPVIWPRGTGPYLYGAFFVDYMARHHGEEYIREFNHRYGRRLIPYALNKITEDITDASVEEHWNGFLAESVGEARARQVAVEARGRTPLEKLTDGGGRNRYPVVRPGSGVTFHRADLTSHPVYAQVSAPGTEPRRIRDAEGAAGPSAWGPDGETLYFSRSEPHMNVYQYQDLYAYTPSTGELRRLTETDRAREPAISPDGTEMVHVRNRAGSMELVRRPLDDVDDAEVLIGRDKWPADEDGHWQQISQPTYTPDGDGVVFSWWRLDRRQRDLFLLDLETGDVEQLTDSPAHDMDPHFGPEGYLYFASDVEDVFNIHAMDVETGEVWQVSNVLRGLFHPQVTEDRRWIYAYTYTHRGFEIARFPHPQRFHHPDRRETERPNPLITYPEIDPEDISEPEPYTALPWLGPMFFTPDVGVATDGAGFAGTVSGYDPTEHHDYTISGGFSTGPDFTDRGANAGLHYRYSGWPIAVSTRLEFRDIPRNRDLVAGSQYVPMVERQYLANLQLAKPISTHDQRFRLTGGFRLDYTTERDRGEVVHEPDDIRPRSPEHGFYNSLSLGLSYSNADRYLHSISTERGITAGVSLSLRHPAIGNPAGGVSVNYTAAGYYPNPWVDRHVGALRMRGAINRDTDGPIRRYAIGGHSPQDVLSSALLQRPRGGFPLRGFPAGNFRGAQYQVWKLEYRFPIIDFDRGFGTAPLFIRNLKGAAFADAGTAFDGFITDADFHTGLGAEMQLDVLLGYHVHNSLTFGYARGFGEEGIDQWYLLFGRSY